jgi:hypothetical protein
VEVPLEIDLEATLCGQLSRGAIFARLARGFQQEEAEANRESLILGSRRSGKHQANRHHQ